MGWDQYQKFILPKHHRSWMYTYLYVYKYISIHTYICICLCIYIYICMNNLIYNDIISSLYIFSLAPPITSPNINQPSFTTLPSHSNVELFQVVVDCRSMWWYRNFRIQRPGAYKITKRFHIPAGFWAGCFFSVQYLSMFEKPGRIDGSQGIIRMFIFPIAKSPMPRHNEPYLSSHTMPCGKSGQECPPGNALETAQRTRNLLCQPQRRTGESLRKQHNKYTLENNRTSKYNPLNQAQKKVKSDESCSFVAKSSNMPSCCIPTIK